MKLSAVAFAAAVALALGGCGVKEVGETTTTTTPTTTDQTSATADFKDQVEEFCPQFGELVNASDALQTKEHGLAATLRATKKYARVERSLADDMEAQLDPPSDVQPQWQAWVNALRGNATAQAHVVEALNEGDQQKMQAAGAEIKKRHARFEKALLDLQDVDGVPACYETP